MADPSLVVTFPPQCVAEEAATPPASGNAAAPK